MRLMTGFYLLVDFIVFDYLCRLIDSSNNQNLQPDLAASIVLWFVSSMRLGRLLVLAVDVL